LACSI